MNLNLPVWLSLFVVAALASCGAGDGPDTPVQQRPAKAKAAGGDYITWKEHLIDGQKIAGGVELRGADGLAMGDLDNDGIEDIVSAHEDSGHIRVAFGSGRPGEYFRHSLAEGAEAAAVEDIAIGDLNQDGFLDVIAACEQAHLIYLENPGEKVRGFRWKRLIPPLTTGRGSYIRVFFADLNGDGRLEVVAANKGTDDPVANPPKEPTAISWFEIKGDPLLPESWVEHELTRIEAPINAQPVDLDGDGDLDIFAGSITLQRILWLENQRGDPPRFVEHPITIEPLNGQETKAAGFNLAFHDFNGDSRLDVALVANYFLVWLEQPVEIDSPWKPHPIGTFLPDHLVGFTIADINGDGNPDIMAGSYSRGARLEDCADETRDDPLGRLGWFEHPGDPAGEWVRRDLLRRKRGMYDSFAARDLDADGDVDFIGTRGNSAEFDGVFWLEQVREGLPLPVFEPARESESQPMPLPLTP